MRILVVQPIAALISAVVFAGAPSALAQEPTLPLDWRITVERHEECQLCRGYSLEIASEGNALLQTISGKHQLDLTEDEAWGIFWSLNRADFFHLGEQYQTGRWTSHPSITKITAEIHDRSRGDERTKTVTHYGNACPAKEHSPPMELCDLEARFDSIASHAQSAERPNKR